MSKNTASSFLLVLLMATLAACGGSGSGSSGSDDSKDDGKNPPPQVSPITNLVNGSEMTASSEYTVEEQSLGFDDDNLTLARITTKIDAFFPDEDTRVADFIQSLSAQGFVDVSTYQGKGKRLEKEAGANLLLTVQWEPVPDAAYQMIEYALISQFDGTDEATDNIETLLPEILINREVGLVQKYTVEYGNYPSPYDPIRDYLQDLQTNQGFTCEDSSEPTCSKDNGENSITVERKKSSKMEYTISDISAELLATAFAANGQPAAAMASSQNENGTLLLNKSNLFRALLPENADGLIDDAKLPAYVEAYTGIFSAAPKGDELVKQFMDSAATNVNIFLEQKVYPRLDWFSLMVDGPSSLLPESIAVNPNYYFYQAHRFYPSEAKATFDQYMTRLKSAGYQLSSDVPGGLKKWSDPEGVWSTISAFDATQHECMGDGGTKHGICVDIQVQAFQPGVLPALLPDRFIRE